MVTAILTSAAVVKPVYGKTSEAITIVILGVPLDMMQPSKPVS